MKRKILLAFLMATFAVGLAVNVVTVVTREAALARESVWLFRVGGFDPLDPFRGRYIEFRVPSLLSVEKDTDGEYPSWLAEGEEFYAVLKRDEAGFGRIAFASADKPDSDGDWLTMRYAGGGSVEPVFSRYYVNAARADALDRKFGANRNSAYITVRISNGVGVITGVGFGE